MGEHAGHQPNSPWPVFGDVTRSRLATGRSKIIETASGSFRWRWMLCWRTVSLTPASRSTGPGDSWACLRSCWRAPDDLFRFGAADVRMYVAGALFSEAERAWLDGLAARLRREGFECLVPHEQFGELTELTPAEVYRVDAEGLRPRTCCPPGSTGRASTTDRPARSACSRAVERDEKRYRGIVGVVTDLRLSDGGVRGRRRDEPLRRRGDQACGRICWSVDEVVEALRSSSPAR